MNKGIRAGLMLVVFVWLPYAYANGIDDARKCSKFRDNRDLQIDHCTRAITSGELSTKNLAITFYNRGRAWYDKKDYDRAIADYNEAIRLNPLDEAAFNNLGRAEFCQGQFSMAADDLAKSQQLKPDIYTAIGLYLARARAGSDGKAELAANTRNLNTRKWPAPVVALYRGKATVASVMSRAAATDPTARHGQRCEANFYVGEWHLLRGEKPQASAFFIQAQNDCQKNFSEYDAAVAELKRLK